MNYLVSLLNTADERKIQGIIANAQGAYYEYCILNEFIKDPDVKITNFNKAQYQSAINIIDGIDGLIEQSGSYSQYKSLKQAIIDGAQDTYNKLKGRILKMEPVGGTNAFGDFKVEWKDHPGEINAALEAKFYSSSTVKYWQTSDNSMFGSRNLFYDFLKATDGETPDYWHIRGQARNKQSKQMEDAPWIDLVRKSPYQKYIKGIAEQHGGDTAFLNYLLRKSESSKEFAGKTILRAIQKKGEFKEVSEIDISTLMYNAMLLSDQIQLIPTSRGGLGMRFVYNKKNIASIGLSEDGVKQLTAAKALEKIHNSRVTEMRVTLAAYGATLQ